MAPQAQHDALLKVEMRRNTYDEQTGQITLSPERAQAVQQVGAHFAALFGDTATHDSLREQYAMKTGSLTAFFF